ncbi:MAG: hypothetical protein Q8P18_21820 [Pseudomonadota bacterium]|nr:hypothetical protein [Pseudomonadota bacterium]
MTTLFLTLLLGCQRAPLPSSWVEVRGRVTQIERVTIEQPLPWPVATSESTDCRVQKA